MEGPGAGVGIGCGAGLGMGVVGGLGIGGVSDWNQLRMVFGIGIGCGVGIGFGYGQGFGFGISFESLQSKLFEPQGDSSSMRNPILLSWQDLFAHIYLISYVSLIDNVILIYVRLVYDNRILS